MGKYSFNERILLVVVQELVNSLKLTIVE